MRIRYLNVNEQTVYIFKTSPVVGRQRLPRILRLVNLQAGFIRMSKFLRYRRMANLIGAVIYRRKPVLVVGAFIYMRSLDI